MNEILVLVSQDSCDPGASEFQTREAAVGRYKAILDLVEDGAFSAAVRTIRPEFAPTGNLQELALTNGWANRYLTMAKRFDKLEKSF